MTEIIQISQPSQVNWWAFHRRLYDWVSSFAHSKHATASLFFLSILESCFIPIAPDVLLIILSIERPKKIWLYAFITTIASVIGGVLGYYIGAEIWERVAPYFFQHVFSEELFSQVQSLYQKWDFWAVFVGAFTPIPYKVFTVTAGVFQVSIFQFIVASLIGRGARFFLVAALIRWFGPNVKIFIDKYFNLLSIAFIVILAGGFLLLHYI